MAAIANTPGLNYGSNALTFLGRMNSSIYMVGSMQRLDTTAHFE
jgi:hypothetical protein